MSNPVNEVIIQMINRFGRWSYLTIMYEESGSKVQEDKRVEWNRSMDNAIASVVRRFFRHYSSTYLQNVNLDKLKCDIVQGFRQMVQNDLNCVFVQQTIYFVPEKQPKPHYSCKMYGNEDSTIQASGKNESSQSEVKQKLSVVKNNSEVMKFFEENKCSVCLSSYREILDDNVHIVVPSCGHPLCCKCADNILRSTKQECPRCRGNITVDVFNLMKFNCNLQIETQDQKVFL